ncbi:hypothetical protein LEP1GSC050_0079 [Leptospira phage vB_LbrZ_5399-LE1]|uniref:Uncharacterized protein n=1 Tax=Leptospira inadai serovar Lyme TaxID=293084 RepID=A0ABX4YH07_9LEPT|nr:hypothetical protein [Leptospira inadai]AGS80766.1 hypothetical protein LEP1GSC050_0079 [Leptospira phage vB_LbrZ_5399-LE1]AGS80788.1 hypothetical protein LEP1GSC047_0891 [Leptospira phage vB_LinZ_10-LE1]PNV74342.1 hypothetical protein BES34_014245 [Leptospira inadai serovar Lyme]
MHVFEVGKLYNPNKTNWREGAFYQCREGRHELALFFSSPTSKEIQSVKTGVHSFGFHYEKNVIFFLFRFYPEINLSDSPFSIHLVLPESGRIPPVDRNRKSEIPLIHITLIDADTGILKAYRTISLKLEFANALEDAILDQLSKPFDQGVYDRSLAETYSHYPTSEDLLKKAIKE